MTNLKPYLNKFKTISKEQYKNALIKSSQLAHKLYKFLKTKSYLKKTAQEILKDYKPEKVNAIITVTKDKQVEVYQQEQEYINKLVNDYQNNNKKNYVT